MSARASALPQCRDDSEKEADRAREGDEIENEARFGIGEHRGQEDRHDRDEADREEGECDAQQSVALRGV